MSEQFHGTLDARSENELRSVKFRCEVAHFLIKLDMTPSEILDWISYELYEVHTGGLLDQKGRPIDPGFMMPKQIWPRGLTRRCRHLDNLRKEIGVPRYRWPGCHLDFNDLFGRDPLATIKSIRKLAKSPPKTLAHRHTVPRWMVLGFAMDIHRGALAQAQTHSSESAV